MLLFVFCFGKGIRVAHRFLFWEGHPCGSSFFVLGGGSLLFIVFLFWDGDPCCFSLFVLGGGSVLLIVFSFERGIRAAHRFLFWEYDPS